MIIKYVKISERFLKDKSRTIRHRERQWSAWHNTPPKTKELPRQSEQALDYLEQLDMQGTLRGEVRANWALAPLFLYQEDGCAKLLRWVRNKRGITFKGFSERQGLLWNLYSRAIISLPPSVTSKLNKYAGNIQLIAPLFGFIPFALPAHHECIALKIQRTQRNLRRREFLW